MAGEPDRHIPEEWLERYALRQLPEPDLADVEEHLLICEGCRNHLDRMDEYIEVMKRAATAEVRKPAAQSRKRMRPWAGWPAPVVGLALGLVVLATATAWRERPAAPIEVNLTSQRGGSADLLAHVPPGARVALRMDVTEIPSAGGYRVEIVDATGKPFWEASVQPAGNVIVAAVPRPLGTGRYWVRLYSVSQPVLLMREYGLVAGGRN